jgi:hypothetical protein
MSLYLILEYPLLSYFISIIYPLSYPCKDKSGYLIFIMNMYIWYSF